MQATAIDLPGHARQGNANPLLKESDEEGAGEAREEAGRGRRPKEKANDEAEKKEKASDKERPARPATVVDLDGIAGGLWLCRSNRVTSGIWPPATRADLLHPPRGRDQPGSGGGSRRCKRFDLKKREEETLAEGIDDFSSRPTARSCSMPAARRPSERRPLAGPPIAGDRRCGQVQQGRRIASTLEAISVRVEPRAEWAQILREAWRINRDYFYATNMHGADWNAVWAKYEELLPHLASRGDLNRVIRMMLSELAVGHSFLFGGERLYEPKPIPVGLLGADYDVADGHFRFKTIYGGAYWDPSLRSPLTAPGVDVKPGEFLLAVDGKEIKADSEVYRPFEGTAGKRVELKVGPKADGSARAPSSSSPIADESSLRNRAWVEGNLRKVHERTKGSVAYVYVPNTAGAGYEYFKRYFFPQADKEAIIVDERFNGGGQVADYYIDMLRRPLVSYWATRYGEPLRTPSAAILGPKVMIIDESAGSGGDLLPWMFRKFGLGKLVGKKTWGGLVGILGFPVLMDGGFVTAPEPGDLHRRRLGRRERGRSSGYRCRARPGRRGGGQGPATRSGDRGCPGGAREEPAAQAAGPSALPGSRAGSGGPHALLRDDKPVAQRVRVAVISPSAPRAAGAP